MKTLSVLLFMFALIGSSLMWAQVTGSISGIVQDTSGAAVPNATVTVRSLETGATRTILTGDIGAEFLIAIFLAVEDQADLCS